ncbi:hypothetical protein T492DRAFT_903216 [Pavlovales sp. CCMP2436]|nr:hypothetical protein T492DRAFT_903216 [Pavlovales sp. CCMP2436]
MGEQPAGPRSHHRPCFSPAVPSADVPRGVESEQPARRRPRTGGEAADAKPPAWAEGELANWPPPRSMPRPPPQSPAGPRTRHRPLYSPAVPSAAESAADAARLQRRHGALLTERRAAARELDSRDPARYAHPPPPPPRLPRSAGAGAGAAAASAATAVEGPAHESGEGVQAGQAQGTRGTDPAWIGCDSQGGSDGAANGATGALPPPPLQPQPQAGAISARARLEAVRRRSMQQRKATALDFERLHVASIRAPRALRGLSARHIDAAAPGAFSELREAYESLSEALVLTAEQWRYHVSDLTSAPAAATAAATAAAAAAATPAAAATAAAWAPLGCAAAV